MSLSLGPNLPGAGGTEAEMLSSMPEAVQMDFLMPTGVMITMNCSRDSTLDAIKRALWLEIHKYPMHDKLQSRNDYIFTIVRFGGVVDELYDESRRLCDIHLFIAVMRLVEPEGNQEERRLNHDIGFAIGTSLADYDEMRDPEVFDARCALFHYVREAVDERRFDDGTDTYCLPIDSSVSAADVANIEDIAACWKISLFMMSNMSYLPGNSTKPPHLMLSTSFDHIASPASPVNRSPQPSRKQSALHSPASAVDFMSSGGDKLTVEVDLTSTKPSDLIKDVICKRIRKFSGSKSSANLPAEGSEQSQAAETCYSAFVLKVAGYQLYLLKDVPLIQYKYLAECVRRRQPPMLMLMCRESLVTCVQAHWQLVPPSFIKRQGGLQRQILSQHSNDAASSTRRPPSFSEPVGNHISYRAPVDMNDKLCLWELWDRILQVETVFRVKICTAGYVNVTDADELYIKVGVYHGTELICALDTQRVLTSKSRWNEVLEFSDIYVPDVPRAAQICFSICSVRYRKQKEDHVALAWVNLRLLDYCDRFVDYRAHLHMWPFPHNFEGFLNPMGHIGSNTYKDTPKVEVEFESFEKEVVWPEYQQVSDYVRFVNRRLPEKQPEWAAYPESETPASEIELLRRVMQRHYAQELSDVEKTSLWRLRDYCCRREPEALPRLLDAVKWSHRAQPATVHVLLNHWPCVTPDTSLALLDHRYPDQCVRAFAVKCLDETLCDDRLQLYLMPLIQVLRYEAFFDNPLSKFLLKRALANQRIGHMFFWLLRSELSGAYAQGATTRFVLLLEAYCRGCGPYLQSLIKQTEATEKLEVLSSVVKEKKDEATKVLIKELKHNMEALQHLESPLDSSYILGSLSLDECRVLTSAKRPLWLVWHNPDPLAHMTTRTHEIIFKNGDDLRQDMLILQVIRIMDTIWRGSGLDFHMTPYSCLPMGKNIGMIEVVKNSKTIYEIQAAQGKRFMDVHVLHRWLRAHNPTEEQFSDAAERFTLSFAGYSVATFVLGIKDRHQDNIMVTHDGRVFHIDFGHFLGHDKKKLGISRDRVPFVINSLFVNVIAHKSDAAKQVSQYDTPEFNRFRDMCMEAYMMLHKHARLFISLFAMMLCMGIPELQKTDDIQYLRRTLGADLSDKEAYKYFEEQFSQACSLSWTTLVNFGMHAFNQQFKNQ